jgi:hypothetical protein
MKTFACLYTLALGAALAPAAQATPVSVTSIISHATQQLVADEFFDKGKGISLRSFDVQTSAGATWLAFCIQPEKTMNTRLAASYSVGDFDGFDGDAQIRRLFSTFYATALASPTASLSFQLALWELFSDSDNQLVDGTGKLDFTLAKNPVQARQDVINGASAMLAAALKDTPVTQNYRYTLFQSDASQWLVSARTVPEPSTWGLVGLGLGMLGFMARRRRA